MLVEALREDREFQMSKNGKLDKKVVKHSYRVCNINISRAIGDADAVVGAQKMRALSCEPEITVNILEQGDVVVLACDGLKDYVKEKEMVTLVAEKVDDLAKHIVETALKSTKDNVTVIALKVV